jgi:hypothetical protein
VQRYPTPERHVSSPLLRETGVAAAPGGGATNAVTHRAVAGLALASRAQPTTMSPRSATPVAAWGWTALMTEILAPTMADAAVVTLPHGRESRSSATRHQPERHGPMPEVILPGTTPVAARKRAIKCAPEKPLAGRLGLVATAGRRDGADGSVGTATEPTPRKWCPLHEMSLHDIAACRHIGHLVEIRRERLAKCATKGSPHGCHECGQVGH